jgi:hypothetical protein
MKDFERRKKMIILGAASACAVAVGCATLAFERAGAPTGELRLSDASSLLKLFPPVQQPAMIPGGSR